MQLRWRISVEHLSTILMWDEGYRDMDAWIETRNRCFEVPRSVRVRESCAKRDTPQVIVSYIVPPA